MEAIMENRKINNPFNRINHSINNIRKIYNNLFLVPEDQGLPIVDRSMPIDQINDTLAYSIQNRVVARMQINLKKSVVEIDGHVHITRSGRLCITDPKTGLTQLLEDQQIRSITII
jgi:hypothetical protein